MTYHICWGSIITLAHGSTIIYLGMSIDVYVHEHAMIIMKDVTSHFRLSRLDVLSDYKGYADEIVKTSGVQGMAKSPATDGIA